MKERVKNKGNEYVRGYLRSYVMTLAIASFLLETNTLKDVLRGTMDWDENQTKIYFTTGTTIAFVGMMIGSFTGGQIVSKLGRRGGMIIQNIILWVGCSIMMIKSTAAFIIGRIIFGYCSGLSSFLVPLFIKEISPVEKSGTMGCTHQLMLTFGLLAATLLGLCAPQLNSKDGEQEDYRRIGDEWSWRLVFAFPLLCSICQTTLLLFYFVNETPKYLMLKGYPSKARKTLSRMFVNKERVEEEMEELEKVSREVSIKELFSPKYRHAFLVACVVCIFQQLSGINALFAYSTDIFKKAGMDASSGVICTNVQNIINILFVFVALFTADLWGRKKLFILGSICCGVTMTLAGVSILNSWNWPTVIMLFAFIIAFEIAHGPLIWVYTAEIVPSSAVSFAITVVWTSCVIITYSAPYLLDLITGWVFIIFGIFMAASLLFAITMIKETKGLSEQEIIKLFHKTDSHIEKRLIKQTLEEQEIPYTLSMNTMNL